jgi:hypothetical protein
MTKVNEEGIAHTRDYKPCYGPLKLTPSCNINLIGVIPTTMDAVSATIVAGGRARFQ